MLATITLTHPRPGAAWLTLAGELDLAALAQLREALEATRGCTDVVVDASGVGFIDWCALLPLVLAARAATRAGGRWRLREPSPALVRLIALCDLEEALPTATPWRARQRHGAGLGGGDGQARGGGGLVEEGSPAEGPRDLGCAGEGVDAVALNRAVAQLASLSTGDFAVESMLAGLCQAAGQALAVDGVGVMSSDGTRTCFVDVDTAALLAVERLQEELQEGPCRTSVDDGAVVLVEDLASAETARRWPRYATAVRHAGLGSVMVVPLLSRGRSWGTVDFYRVAAGRWSAAERAAGQLLADVAASYIVMSADRDAARAAQEELVQRSLHDALTGLPNRALFFDRLRHALQGGHRAKTAPVAVMFIDLDRFKEVNDSFGHASGDTVLVEVARRMSATLREGDTLARLAGDEFVLLCENLPAGGAPELDSLIATITGRLRAALVPAIRLDRVDVVVSASIGVALTGERPSAEDLLHDADMAMYQAKEHGRNRVQVRDHTLGAVHGYGHQLKQDLSHALERGELVVYYQPIVSVADGRTRAVEALLRWHHPRHGLLPAKKFLQLAASAGALPRIGHWVIDQACAQLARWRAQVPGGGPQRVSCNLSARELADARLPGAIERALGAHALQPSDLGLEVVEDDLSDPRLTALLTALHQRGHQLSIDDFGTGYSSLSRLVTLPVAVTKIDRAFVAGLPGDQRSQALVRAVMTIAQGLQVEVVGEGVENAAQADYLSAMGCTYLQGHHLAPALPGDEITSLLLGELPQR